MLGCSRVLYFVFAAGIFGSAFSSARADLQQYAETPILKFHLEKNPLKVGQSQTIYIQAAVGFTKNEVVLESFLDGVRVDLNQTAPSLWVLALTPFTEIKSHLLNINIYIRDAQQATRIREALSSLDQELALLDIKIFQEQDQAKRDALIAIRGDKQAIHDRLEEENSNLRVFLKSEELSFRVRRDQNNVDFPLIESIEPNLGAKEGGTVVQITGLNFPAAMSASLPVVKIDGLNASVVSMNGNVISIVTPAFASKGAKSIEIIFTTPAGIKNATFRNGFFVVAASSLMGNLRPVAVTNGYQTKNWPNPGPVTLNGSSSYDENGDSISYSWVIKAVAKNSAFVPGTVLSTAAIAVFTPDKKGVFSFELKVRETSTSQTKESFPATATVEVN